MSAKTGETEVDTAETPTPPKANSGHGEYYIIYE